MNPIDIDDSHAHPRDPDSASFGRSLEQMVGEVTRLVSAQVQARPLQTLAVAAGIGFLVASSKKNRIIPSLLKSGVGMAAAFALRQAASRGLDTSSEQI